jgi:hypothetical protein
MLPEVSAASSSSRRGRLRITTPDAATPLIQ